MVITRTHPNLKQLISLLAEVFLIAACGSARTDELPDPLETPTMAENNTPTQTPVLINSTLTPPPNTLTPEAETNELMTPMSTISPDGFPDPNSPLYDDGQWKLELAPDGVYVMNHDLTSRTLLIPYAPKLTPAGPRDRWFRYEIGSKGWTAVRVGPGQDEGAAPRLFLIKLPYADVSVELPILSQEHLIRMRKRNEDGFPEVIDDLYKAIHGFRFEDSMAWAPDGERLAFVAALDGPSADVYLYNTQTDELIRLTDGPNQPYFNGWSPDGKWVLHQEVENIWLGGNGIEFDPIALWAAAANGNGSIHLLAVDEQIVIKDWISSTQFVAHLQDFDYFAKSHLQLVDLYSGVVSTYYSGYFYALAVDPVTGTVVFTAGSRRPYPENQLDAGLYMVTPASRTPMLVGFSEPIDEDKSGLVASAEWSPMLGVFEVSTRGGEVYWVTTEGLVTRGGDSQDDLLPSRRNIRSEDK
jgi:hypothetical protein